MNQSQLIEKVARETELNQAAAGQAVKAMVKAILDSLVAGEPVRVSGLGTFDVASRPARQGRNLQSGETIKIAASKAVRFHAGKAAKHALNPPRRSSRKTPAPPRKSSPLKKSAIRK
jgi:DNA-binding protein HU-beta